MDQTSETQERTDDIFSQRLAKRNDMITAGENPYGSRTDGVIRSADAKKLYVPGAAEQTAQVKAAGRIIGFRIMGKASFMHIQDEQGRLQLFASRDVMGEESYRKFKKLDIGDIIEATGTCSRRRPGRSL